MERHIKWILSIVFIIFISIFVGGIYIFDDIFPKAKPIILSKTENVVSIYIGYNSSAMTFPMSKQDWDKTMLHIEKAKPTRQQSMNDHPDVRDYYGISIQTTGRQYYYFIYEKGNQVYIESSYEGIYEVDNELLDIVLQYFQESSFTKYFSYFSENNRQINPIFKFPSNDTSENDSNLIMFAIQNIPNYTYEIGNTPEEINSIIQKYFNTLPTSYETSASTILPSGNITSTGWSNHGTNYLLLDGETQPNANGSITALFDLYCLPELPELIDKETDGFTYLEVIEKLKNNDVAGLQNFYKGKVNMTFFEKIDENNQMYLQYVSIEPLYN